MYALHAVVKFWILSMMMALASTEGPAPWRDTYEATADTIADEPYLAPVLVALAWHESRFNPEAVGDHGTAHGLWQSHRDPSLTGVVQDINASLRACAYLPWFERLSRYTSGTCQRGHASSRIRLTLAAALAP